jgi:hypothetical protein
MEITQDYLFKVIGIQTTRTFALEEANTQLIAEKDELQKAFNELQKTIKTQTEDV